MVDMNKILDEAIAKDASDIHLIMWTNKPMLRISKTIATNRRNGSINRRRYELIYMII